MGELAGAGPGEIHAQGRARRRQAGDRAQARRFRRRPRRREGAHRRADPAEAGHSSVRDSDRIIEMARDPERPAAEKLGL